MVPKVERKQKWQKSAGHRALFSFREKYLAKYGQE
jgi:hypothetical protein